MRIKPRVFYIASFLSYGGGVVHYAFKEMKLVPFLGGWIAGLLLMEGVSRRRY